jgi:hypothetical protein
MDLVVAVLVIVLIVVRRVVVTQCNSAHRFVQYDPSTGLYCNENGQQQPYYDDNGGGQYGDDGLYYYDNNNGGQPRADGPFYDDNDQAGRCDNDPDGRGGDGLSTMICTVETGADFSLTAPQPIKTSGQDEASRSVKAKEMGYRK